VNGIPRPGRAPSQRAPMATEASFGLSRGLNGLIGSNNNGFLSCVFQGSGRGSDVEGAESPKSENGVITKVNYRKVNLN